MSVRLKVNDKELNRALSNATAEGLAQATQYYHSQLKIVVNKPNTGTRVKGRNGKQRTIYNNSSKPGEAPHKRTGFGQRGIVREIDRKSLIARVGVTANAIYMYFLELGTKHIARRPWLMATLKKRKQIIARLFMTKSRQQIPNT